MLTDREVLYGCVIGMDGIVHLFSGTSYTARCGEVNYVHSGIKAIGQVTCQSCLAEHAAQRLVASRLP